ncbi:MAG TPA: cytoplasmic protein [Anaerolineaceae bacterium]|nr:cytoplasmic protein [Anaerolineaceae bacterium]
MKDQSRREFLRNLMLGATTLAAQPILTSCGVKPVAETQIPAETQIATDFASTENATEVPTDTQNQYPYLVVTRGSDAEKMVRQGMLALGGMERFMKPGADVIIKPNICIGYYSYEYAATTNPWVVAALVKMCLEVGAKRVRVMDFPFGGTGEQCYKNSGIADLVTAAGGEMEVMSDLKFVEMSIPDAVRLKKASIYQDVLTTDLLINVPIAKTHGMAKLTLGLKNLMGTMLNRESIHPSFEQNLVDLATVVRPHLTIIDAIRTLMANGPTGGNLDDVKLQNTLIFSHDIVAADSYATRLFDKTPDYLPYVIKAAERGLGKADLTGLNIQEINIDA